MAPKKKKPPVVVGTVSTRSTRRESIVNIKIIPKANKSATRPLSLKKTVESTLQETQTTCDQEELSLEQSPEETRPEILEILKDWSDDETSQDNIISIYNVSNSSSFQLADDQQSLIDILEGKQADAQDQGQLFQKTTAQSGKKTSYLKKSIKAKDKLIENQVVNLDSPKVEDSEIIEECVVEDDSFIIVLPEERSDGGNMDELQNVRDKIVDNSANCDNQETMNSVCQLKKTSNIFKKMSSSLNQNLKGTHDAEEDASSETSEDKISQSIVAVKDVLDNNDIHISDSTSNSTSNYEIVEEQVVCDSSEPIIIEHLDTVLTEDSSKESVNSGTNIARYFLSNRKSLKEIHASSHGESHSQLGGSLVLVEHKDENSDKVVKQLGDSISDTELLLNKDLNLMKISTSESRNTPVCSKQGHKKSDISVELDENNLCQNISQSMQISQVSNKKPQVESENLQDGISRISIKNEEEVSPYLTSIDPNYSHKNVNTMSYSDPLSNPLDADDKCMPSTPPKDKHIRNVFDSSSNRSPNISPGALSKFKLERHAGIESDSRQTRSFRKKTIEFEMLDLIEKSNSADKYMTTEKVLSDPISKSLYMRDNVKTSIKTDSSKTGFGNSKLLYSEFTITKEEVGVGAKVSKVKSKKVQQKLVLDHRIDIDSESSETKTSEEAEGDSPESSQDQVSTKLKEAKTNISENVLCENALSEMSINEKETEMSIVELISNRKSPKGNKIKTKKEYKKGVVEEMSKMDMECSIPKDSMKISMIDATIDEVLRKYTYEEPDSGNSSGILKELSSSKDKNRLSKEFKRKKDTKFKKDDKNGESSEEVRRSDRIKTIAPVKKKSHGLVRSKSEPLLIDADNSDSSSVHNDSDKSTPFASPQLSKVDKTKSKAKSAENLQVVSLPSTASPELPKPIDMKADQSSQAEIDARLKTFIHLKENQYKTDRQVCKEARGMVCDCFLAEEDIQNNEFGCGEDCLNRLLMIECGELCQVGGRCTNKRFQKNLFAPVEVFKTDKKGLGLRAAANIAYGEFILEYIGEVLNPDEFDKRAEVYSKDKNIHFYFMSLRADAIIDATMKGNISRFINHSCDPNAETQKWTANGELRIGFFSTRTILAGEEITFDYRFQRYGKEAQKCYCEAATCRGWLGERPDESEDEDEEEEDEPAKVSTEPTKAEIKVPDVLPKEQLLVDEKAWPQETLPVATMDTEETTSVSAEVAEPKDVPIGPELQETPKKIIKKKLRKEMLYDDVDQLNEDIEMLVTTGLKNQAHTLKLSRLMVRAKDIEQRKKLLRVLRRGELPCRRLFLDYHGLRLMHGYMIDAQQLTSSDAKVLSKLEIIQTKLELLQTLAVLPIQSKTMLIESKVLPAVEKWAKNEDIVEDSDQRDVKKSPEENRKNDNDTLDPAANEKIDEIKFLATKLVEEWVNLKESFRIPKKQRIEQMKEHEKEANRKFMESSYAQEKEQSRKHDQRYRTWSRYKSERETSKKAPRSEDKDRPSAEYLKISKHERRKLFALQMELKEEERRSKQREMWRQHEMNCMMIGADPRFTAPFDPSKGFQYIWNPSLGQWQALPVPTAQNQGVYNSPANTQGVSSYNIPPPHKQPLISGYTSMMNVPGMQGAAPQYPGLQPTLPSIHGLASSVSSMVNTVAGLSASLPGIPSNVPGMHGLPGSMPGIAGSLPGITQPPLPTLPMYQEVKQEDPSQVKFAGPIPPPAKLPPKWKCAKDKYGRPYYYHVKLRKSQWEPPPIPVPVEESSESSSSETSSGSSSDSSSDSDTEDEIDDAKLLVEVKKQMESSTKVSVKSTILDHIKKEGGDSVTPSPDMKVESDNEDASNASFKDEKKSECLSSIDIRLKEQFNLDSNDPPKKKRRIGLCQEIIISPRTDEDRKQFKEDLKRYRATKEKLKRQKEQMLQQSKKKLKTTSSGDSLEIKGDRETRRPREKRSSKSKSRTKEMKEWNDEHAKKIKEVFRSTMATTVVSVLNAFRKPDCKESRITNTEDFKHLARKLTHFVMLKEIKHISSIDELVCTDNVKAKAREYIRKYMSKFGEVYQKRHDEPDFKD